MQAVPIALCLAFFLPAAVSAQTSTGSVTGHVTDEAAKPVNGATVRLVGAPYGARSHDDGAFRIDFVPAGTYRIRVTIIGFNPDTQTVVVQGGGAADVMVKLRPAAVNLPAVMVTAYRMGESKDVALDKQKDADNIVSVLSGDEIRALPNANAAEAAGRIPGVSLERDEGEGKFVQVRGTEPRLQNVTVDGSHVPGTEQGDRIVKLDDVPAEILSAIEVSKTLTADMDADAIGGSVNLVTKVPEGAPRGYVSGQFGHITLLDHTTGQGGLTWGGRFGADQKLGFLIGGSIDRFNRVINDVEPSWSVDNAGVSHPVEWSERDYSYFRDRYGLGGDLDYRFNGHSQLFAKGMWSKFLNHGNRYVYDVSGNDSTGSGGDYLTGVDLQRQVQLRTPTEQLWGMTIGGKQDNGQWFLDYAANLAGTEQNTVDYRSTTFDYGPSYILAINGSNPEKPAYQYLSGANATDAATATNYGLTNYSSDNGLTTGKDLGGQVNLQRNYLMGGRPGAIKFGLRLRNEEKDYSQNNESFKGSGSYLLSQALSGFADPNFYNYLQPGFLLGPLPDFGTSTQYENANPGAFTNKTDSIGNALASFTGKERILAGYVMNDIDLSPAFHLNLGVRVEMTHSTYTGNVANTPTDTLGNPTGPTTVSAVSGTHDYTDVFPSAQFRYGVDENTNVRIAATRGIARPNYSDLAPSLQGNLNTIYQHQYNNLTAGNPNLKPEHSWNFDLLVEKYLPSVGGVISGGVFYKKITDFIGTKGFIYNGPYAAFDGYYGTEKQNGGDGHLEGFEADWSQHLTFLPGALSGLGFDVNWTHVSSSVVVDTTTGRTAMMLRTSPDVANAAVTYDKGFISARVAWTYNGANIDQYNDGTPTANGDNYFYAHSQIDASAILTVAPNVQMQLQVLNINNAVFGFFQGTPDHQFNVQREYYGQTFYLGLKYGF
ncbi:MAG TPA: TonB-dependent receptor [Gemmatimonadales bacterium]|nr:TonB-dependent receptor [Gemmatimonadales bacterium]